MKQFPAQRRQQMQADRHRPGALAEQSHVVGVAAERADVPLDPAQARQLVVESGVARGARVVEAEEAERADTVADRDDDDVVLGGQNLAVVDVQRRRAAVEPAAEYPHLQTDTAPASLNHCLMINHCD